MTRRFASEALRGLLADLPARVPPEEMDRVWIFAPRDLGGRESGLVVLGLLPLAGEEAEQRRVVTVSYEAQPTRGGVQRVDTLVEQGIVPRDRVPELISGVLRRLGGEGEDPVEGRVEGDRARWRDLVESLGAELDREDGE